MAQPSSVEPHGLQRHSGGRMPAESERAPAQHAACGERREMSLRSGTRALCLAIGLFALALGGTANAHHSFAMFDQSQQVTLKGTVREFQWTNPHAWIHLDVPNANGVKDTWQGDMNSPNNTKPQGRKSTSTK